MLLGARERSSMSLYHGDRAKRNQLGRFSFNRPGRHRGWHAKKASTLEMDGRTKTSKISSHCPKTSYMAFFFGRSCKDGDIRTHGLSAAQTDVFCFCMILLLSLRTTLLRRHRQTISTHETVVAFTHYHKLLNLPHVEQRCDCCQTKVFQV